MLWVTPSLQYKNCNVGILHIPCRLWPEDEGSRLIFSRWNPSTLDRRIFHFRRCWKAQFPVQLSHSTETCGPLWTLAVLGGDSSTVVRELSFQCWREGGHCWLNRMSWCLVPSHMGYSLCVCGHLGKSLKQMWPGFENLPSPLSEDQLFPLLFFLLWFSCVCIKLENRKQKL